MINWLRQLLGIHSPSREFRTLSVQVANRLAIMASVANPRVPIITKPIAELLSESAFMRANGGCLPEWVFKVLEGNGDLAESNGVIGMVNVAYAAAGLRPLSMRSVRFEAADAFTTIANMIGISGPGPSCAGKFPSCLCMRQAMLMFMPPGFNIASHYGSWRLVTPNGFVLKAEDFHSANVPALRMLWREFVRGEYGAHYTPEQADAIVAAFAASFR